MNDDRNGFIETRFARLSTGAKMLLILGLALLPLGLIAIVASIQSARQEAEERREETLARLEVKAQRIEGVLSRAAIIIGTASGAVAVTPPSSPICQATLRRLADGLGGRFSLIATGRRLSCATPDFVPPAAPPAPAGARTLARLSPDETALHLFVYGEEGALEGVAEFSRESLSALSYLPGTSRTFDLELRDGDREMVLRNEYAGGPFVQTVSGIRAVAGGQLQLGIVLGATPISAAELLLILLPVLMWLAAGVIGWVVVDRLLLRPLARMQRVVSAYRPGDRNLDLPKLATPAREIGELGQAFDQVAQTVARHESELEAAVERQTKLVREVHHRVKNNLQVVASLLNLHARGAASEDVAAAYASIQRRVDALAVVHRNHYAELEENRGVALKPLISELAANLRATAPASATSMVIRLDLEPYYATQDVAVSVAFLITEMVEFAMFCGSASVQISLTGKDAPRSASLTIEADSLRFNVPCDENLSDRFERIVTGLSRQLRSSIARDQEAGRYSLDIAVVDKADRG